MAKRPISVTLETDNLVWLRGRAGASGESVSQVLDEIVTAARVEGRSGPSRSVAGTIDIDSSDPLLEGADAIVRSMFDTSLGRPLIVAEPRASYQRGTKASRKHRG
jgi:hypothetical protein